ncbi:MAG: UDP-2,3-diacylglucosamine diphosphatase LpxI [Kiritimatiellae bacterium]|nr:UDP-2,3-diacylglucosamine diphosphatase LpxI [Kiritimatiellia bacterium]
MKPKELCIIAGKGAYPRLLAESAKEQGVERLVAVAFRKETDPVIEKYADETVWVRLGELGALLDALKETGIKHAVMVGQITPTHLFRIRMDGKMLALLKSLPRRNAETIFGAVADEMKGIGVELIPASTSMESHMPEAGVLTSRGPTDEEKVDIEIGLAAARATSDLDIGQTVVVKQGTILAVEAFEGTNDAIRRAVRLGGEGVVVVKVAKDGHDMRFDIPVIGLQTMKIFKKLKVRALAVEAGCAIFLERKKALAEADRLDMCIVAVATEGDGSNGR